ncbi:hypothetical protein JMG10_14035 [Nostoc ellipsosporum NOK]|nr:hypothetical protein [Nostoc ellipsosporum NOK]
MDKHYHIRYKFGDERGKREGIAPEKIKLIVNEAIKHLVAYSAFVKSFSFLNHDHIRGEKALRIVCKKELGGHVTNVVIEVHYIDLDEFEITIITALQADDFRLGDGQYAILLNENGSSLLHFSRGKLKEVHSLYKDC